MASKKATFDEASSSAIKEEVHERDPMAGTGKLLPGEVSSKKSVHQTREFLVKIGNKKNYVVRGDFHSNVLSALSSIDDISKRMENEKKKNRVPYLRGITGIEGYINLGMPLKCVPEDLTTEMKFFKRKNKTTDKYLRDFAGEEELILFYIQPVGLRSDTKAAQSHKIIKCEDLENDYYMCVLAPEGETIKDALCKDGRFLPLLEEGNWELKEGAKFWANTLRVDKKIENMRFQVGLKKAPKDTDGTGGPHEEQNIPPFQDHKEQNILPESVRTGDVPNTEQAKHCRSQAKPRSSKEQAPLVSYKIYLKDLPSAPEHYSVFMEQRNIINMHFREAQDKKMKFLAARKEEFDKVTKNSSRIKTQKILIPRSESVGYIEWGTTIKEGSATCFVLCSRYILTCCHVVRFIAGEETDTKEIANKICESASVYFSYEEKHPEKKHRFSLEPWIEIANHELDYAVLRLKLEENKEIPNGLVEFHSPPPFNGLIYIIGHPDGEAKSMDACSVVSIMERLKECEWRLKEWEESKDSIHRVQCIQLYTPRSFPEVIDRPEKVTYDTTFFYGSSGSPVFNHDGVLIALHAGGYVCKCKEKKRSIIEYGISIRSILSDMANNKATWYYSEIYPFSKYPQEPEAPVASDTVCAMEID